MKEPGTAPPAEQWFPLTLGSTLRDPTPSSRFYSLRYEFKPASIDTTRPGSLFKSTDNKVTVDFCNNQAGKPKVSFQGNSEDCKELDAVIFFDGKSFRLERLHRAVKSLRHVRLPGESAGSTNVNNIGGGAGSMAGASAAEPANSPGHQNGAGLVSAATINVEKINPKVQVEEITVGQTEASGAKANFISPELASRLGIRSEEMGYTTEAGLACPGHTEAVTPIIGKLRLHTQSYVDVEEFYIMPLDGCDVLLGIPWLFRVQGILDAYNKKIIVQSRGKTLILDVKLKGESIPTISAFAISSVMKKHLSAYLVFAREVSDCDESNLSVLDKERSMFLQQYSDCFSDSLPSQLPPERLEDHAIDLVPCSSPPNRPPYRVSAAQQKEIMSQVEELLGKGLIQPSLSQDRKRKLKLK
ncbi:hypothetical protein L7F22_042534 [Adiantum nelumboides]|nr:hypothetical protein [Adiantum nelumboides]